MKLELIREKSKHFPIIENPLDYTEIKIWHCRYQSLSRIRAFKNVEDIEIATFPDTSLEFIGKLSKVKSLRIIHLPKVNEISPLSKLKVLETLYLAVLPSWNKFQHIASLKPLGKLSTLHSLSLHGIFINDNSLQPLHSCSTLNEFHSGNLFSIEELLNLKVVKSKIKGMFFEPIVEIPNVRCPKCSSLKVVLSGVIKYGIHCPKCHSKRVQKHLDEWKNIESKCAT